MGHDIHFLKRLERVSLPHVELAMSLYNDSLLVEFILHKARLPESAESVAISLADPERGPFVIVTRTGRFVTCLGEGMRVEPETPVITRQHLDSIVEKADDFRARIEQAYRVAGNKGRVHQLLRRIYTAADDLSREEFIGLSAWRPLLGREFLLQLLDAVRYLEDARRVLRKLDKPPRQYEAMLRDYWNVFWAMGHLALLVGSDARELLEVAPEILTLMTESRVTLSWGLVRQGFLPLALRGAWLAGKLGKSGATLYKHAYEQAESPLQLIDTGLGLVALAARHSGLRGEIRKALPRQFPQEGTFLDRFMNAIIAAARAATTLYFDDQDTYRENILDIGRKTYLRMTGTVPPGSPIEPEHLASVREDLVLPSIAAFPFCYLNDVEMTLHTFMMMPYAARAEPEAFYYLQADLARITRPWQPEDSLQLLRMFRDRDRGGSPRPVRVEKAPGRNDPCPCGSGKKYKRCCGLSPSSGPA